MIKVKTFQIVHYKLTDNYVVIDKNTKEFLKKDKITGGTVSTYVKSDITVLKSLEECDKLIKLYIDPLPKKIIEERWAVEE